MDIGFVGTGNMGRPMATNMLTGRSAALTAPRDSSGAPSL